MKEKLQRLSVQAWIAIMLSILAACTFVAGIIIPPPGVVDNSVLIGMGILTALVAIFFAWDSIDKGMDARVEHGDTKVVITKTKEH